MKGVRATLVLGFLAFGAVPAASAQSVLSAEDVDVLLDTVATEPLKRSYCREMQADSAAMYSFASMEPDMASVAVLETTAPYVCDRSDPCKTASVTTPMGPILRTETRYFVLIGDADACEIKILRDRS